MLMIIIILFQTAPRCHRDCKSKVLLDSISKSCHAMRECLKENQTFEKYFQEVFFVLDNFHNTVLCYVVCFHNLHLIIRRKNLKLVIGHVNDV